MQTMTERTDAAMRAIAAGRARNPPHDLHSVTFKVPCATRAESIAINRFLLMGLVRVAHVGPGCVYLVAIEKGGA